MQMITINIQNENLTEKVLWFFEHLKQDGLEITSKEDIEDLKLLKKQGMKRRSLLKIRVLFDVIDNTIVIGRVLHRQSGY